MAVSFEEMHGKVENLGFKFSHLDTFGSEAWLHFEMPSAFSSFQPRGLYALRATENHILQRDAPHLKPLKQLLNSFEDEAVKWAHTYLVTISHKKQSGKMHAVLVLNRRLTNKEKDFIQSLKNRVV